MNLVNELEMSIHLTKQGFYSMISNMVQLTTAQRSFLVKKYHETRSYLQTQEAFHLMFPDRDPPTKKTIWLNVRKYEAEGTSHNLNKGRSGRRKSARTEENIEAVRQQLEHHPHQTSARRNGVGLTQASFNRITRLDLNLHPYRLHVRHELMPADLNRRRDFSQWILQRCNRDQRFIRNLVIGDEAAFALNEGANRKNNVHYAPSRHPPAFNFEKRCSREKVTVWVGLCGNGVVLGPFFFDANVNGQTYLRMINEQVVPQLENNFPRQENGMFRYLWWAQDGAPAHRLGAVTDRLRELFHQRVIAMHQAVEWPPRSPDLTPCDFFLWGYLKDRVFVTPPGTLQELRERIQVEVDRLRANPEQVRQVMNGIQRRCQLCLERGGGHIEGLGA